MVLFAMPAPTWLTGGSEFMQHIGSYINEKGLYLAAIIFIIAAITDLLDGYLARKLGVVTSMGIFLDPIADKLLVASALIALNCRGLVDGWIVIIIIAREFIVSGLRLIAAGEGTIVAADKTGKLKTVLQIVAISAMFLGNFPLSLIVDFDFGYYIMIVATIITLYSGYNYIRMNKHILIDNK